MVELYQGDCLEEMNHIADHSVDMIFTDLPYGTTHNSWDTPIPLDALWKQYKRVLKIGGESFSSRRCHLQLTLSIAIASGSDMNGYGIRPWR